MYATYKSSDDKKLKSYSPVKGMCDVEFNQ